MANFGSATHRCCVAMLFNSSLLASCHENMIHMPRLLLINDSADHRHLTCGAAFGQQWKHMMWIPIGLSEKFYNVIWCAPRPRTSMSENNLSFHQLCPLLQEHSWNFHETLAEYYWKMMGGWMETPNSSWCHHDAGAPCHLSHGHYGNRFSLNRVVGGRHYRGKTAEGRMLLHCTTTMGEM